MPRPTPFPLSSVKTKRSSAGLGLFAVTDIPKSQYIEYIGPLLTNAQADEKEGMYLFKVNSRWTIDGSSRHNIARYVNHSCRPNCEAEVHGKRILIITKRRIKTDEELTLHYGKEYFDEFIKPYGCRCEACRQARD